jgi:O-antigen/teichoic acid export membrane protein
VSGGAEPNDPLDLPGGVRRLAVRGVAWGGIETAAGALVGLILTPLVIRASGLEGLGLWAAAWSLAHSATAVDLGVAASYARFTARAAARGDTAGLNRTLGAGLGFYLAFSLLLVSLALPLVPRVILHLAPPPALEGAAPKVLWCALLAVCLRATLSIYRGVLAGAQRLDLIGRIGTAGALVEGCGAAALILAGGGLAGMAINSLAVAAVTCAVEAFWAHRVCPGLRVRPFAASRTEWRDVLGFGARLQATRAAEIFGTHVPRLALALGPGLSASGIYDLGSRVAGVLRIGGALPLPILQPLASRLEARGERHRLGDLLGRSTRYVALLALPALALVLLDAPALLTAWTGTPQPAEAAQSARLLAVATCVSLVSSPFRLMLRGVGHPGIEATAAVGSALVHLLLAAALAGPWGAPGVAFAALPAAVLSAAILAGGARRRRADLDSGGIAPAVAGPIVAGVAGLMAGWALQLLGTAGEAATRGQALARLVPEATVVVGIGALAAILAGGIRREDLLVVRGGGA